MNDVWLETVKKAGLASQGSRIEAYKARLFESQHLLSLGYLREAQRINAEAELLLAQAGIHHSDTSEKAQEYRKVVSEAFGLRTCPYCHETKPDKEFRSTGGYRQTCVCWGCTSRSTMLCLTCGLPCTVLGIEVEDDVGVPLEPDENGFGRIIGVETDRDLINKCMRCRKNAIDDRGRGIIKRIIRGFFEWVAGWMVD